MSSLNKVALIGTLGRDPEVRATAQGKEIANLSLATTETWKDRNTGERKEQTEWHKVAVFSEGLVRVIKQYLKKGSKIYIEGSLKTRKWTDNAGAERYTTEIVLNGFESKLIMLDAFSGSKNTSYQTKNASASNLDDEVPF